MKRLNDKGYIGDVIGVALVIVFVLAIVWGVSALLRIRWSPSESRVSGIVYNVKNDKWISGSTSFSVRAAVDTYVTEENASNYCLPAGSPYIALVNKAAEDKDIKVVVRTSKVSFRLVEGVTTCVDNTTVEQVKK